MKESITKFDLEAAFKALDEIEAPVVENGIKANKPALTEIFSRKSKFDALFEEYYDVNNSAELSDAKEAREAEIAKAKLARIEKIVDLDAESPEDLLTSYVGKLIIQCPQCMTLFYKDAEDVEESEEDSTTVNVNETCQHCGNESGYMLIGKVGEVTPEEAAEELGVDVEAEETEEAENVEVPEETEVAPEEPEGELDLDLGDELEEIDLGADEEEAKQEEALFVSHEGDSLVEELQEDADLEVSAAEFEELISSPEFKKPISDRAARAMIDEFEESITTPNKTLAEGTGSETAHIVRDALNTINKEDKEGLAKTVADIIDIVPDEFIDDLFDTAKNKLGEVKLALTDKSKIIATADGEVKNTEDADTIGKVLSLFDITTWDAESVKKCVAAVLGVVAVIEPTPVVEIITGLVLMLPAEAVRTIMAIINPIGTLANKGYQAIKNKDKDSTDSDNIKLDEGVFNKLKDKFSNAIDAVTNKLKSREAKADWILENALEDYNNVKADEKGQLVPDEDNRRFQTFIVIGYKNNYSNGKEILKAPSFNSIKDLVMGMNKAQVTDEYAKADDIAKGWSMTPGNGPAFIYMSKDENDEKAVFLCEYFKGKLEYDQVEKYFGVVKNHLKGAKLMARGGMDDSKETTDTAEVDESKISEVSVAKIEPGMKIDLDGEVVEVSGVGPLVRTADGSTAYESVLEVTGADGKRSLYNMPKSEKVRVYKENLNVIMDSLEELQEATLEKLIADSLVESYKNVAGFRLSECSYLDEKLQVHGKIFFTSGNTRKTTYTFTEAYKANEDKIVFKGLNEKLGSNSQFILTGESNTVTKTFIAESFSSTRK